METKKSLVEYYKKEIINWRNTVSESRRARDFEDKEFERLKKVCGFLPELGNKELIDGELKILLAEEVLKK